MKPFLTRISVTPVAACALILAITAFLFLLLPRPVTAGQNSAETQEDIARRLQQNYDQIKSLSFHFTQNTTGELSGRPQQGSGTAWFVKEKKSEGTPGTIGKMRWDYATPEKQILVSDGVNFSMYFAKLEQMIVSPAETMRTDITYSFFTGAGNLRHMTTTLAREVERATRFGRPLSLLLLDLDHFKNVNDTYGHTVGDAVLRELARRLAGCVREVDIVARYGGEEFVVVTPETDIVGAEHLADRICEAVREEPFVVGNDIVVVTVSVGIATLPTHGIVSGDLVRAADEGLYAAKRGGRDQYRVAPSGEVAPAGEPAADR